MNILIWSWSQISSIISIFKSSIASYLDEGSIIFVQMSVTLASYSDFAGSGLWITDTFLEFMFVNLYRILSEEFNALLGVGYYFSFAFDV